MNNITFEKFQLSAYKNNPIVTDKRIASLYGISGDNVYLLPAGERAKSFKHVQSLCRWFLSRNLNKDDTVVAVGGGSVGDTVGFAASIFKRGVKLLHVPTTLIAQIDSSIGGKTAIDVDGVKNAVGSYHFADTLIDVNFLNTLDKKQLASGYGELLKYRMLSSDVDEAYGAHGELLETIRACVEYKQRICNVDPYCQGVRNTLNFGHTVGHALELTYKIPHGVAVANGIYYETLLAEKLGKCSCDYADRWMGDVKRNFTLYPLTKDVVKLTQNDKKNVGGKVGFVLPEDFSETFLTTDEMEDLLNA